MTGTAAQQPLADRLRPGRVEQVLGQDHLTAPGMPVYQAIRNGAVQSMVLWGPPGVGKTTLARIIAHQAKLEFDTLSAVTDGVAEVRRVVKEARERQGSTLLFVDEVHRFNKAQQDAFLPHIESGLLVLVGATTENPSFALNNALLSRVRVYVLKSLTAEGIRQVIERGLACLEESGIAVSLDEEAVDALVDIADGDARRALNTLEAAVQLAGDGVVTAKHIEQASGDNVRRFDRGGDIFYDLISALHKSIRGSDVDASLYWLARMLDGGADPNYLSRRLIRIASEDIGNADPRALEISINAADAYNRLGSPEGELALAQATAYLAVAAKSNAVYKAFNQALADMKRFGSREVPPHLRNAPTRLAKDLGHGEGYRYAHDEAEGFAAGERYFPIDMPEQRYYVPVNRGLEQKIAEKLEHLRKTNQLAGEKRRR